MKKLSFLHFCIFIGMFPMYYAPATHQPMPSTSAAPNPPQAHHFPAPAS